MPHTWHEKKDSAHVSIYMNSNKAFNDKWLTRITPDFQRDNNKWSAKMQTKFIENLLSGAKVELLFFRFDEHEDAKILDGLQRTTAIIDFFNGKIKPFGYSYNDLKDAIGLFRTHITIKIYTFSTIDEVIQFYIDINENITHSAEDIQKAKSILARCSEDKGQQI